MGDPLEGRFRFAEFEHSGVLTGIEATFRRDAGGRVNAGCCLTRFVPGMGRPQGLKPGSFQALYGTTESRALIQEPLRSLLPI